MKEPGHFLSLMNRRLCQLLSSATDFATALCGVIDLKQQTLRIASAGGPAPLIYRQSAGGSGTEAACSGQPLGFIAEGEFDEILVRLTGGDRVLLFTDGLYEINCADGQQLGIEGTQRILMEMGYPRQPLDFRELEQLLLGFSNAIRFEDDLTVIELTLRS